MLSNGCKYAIRSLIYLAVNGKDKPIGLKEISDELNIPFPYLSKVMQNLTKHAYLKSTKGPTGGYILNKKASEVSLLEIVKLIDGLSIFNDCLIGLTSCLDSDTTDHCPTYSRFEPVRKELYNYFETETIQHLKEELVSKGNIRI